MQDLTPSSFFAGEAQFLTYDNDGLLTGIGAFAIMRNAQSGLPESISDDNIAIARTISGYGEIDGAAYAIGGGDKYGYSLTRDLAGRIIQKIETIGGAADTYNYTYDNNGRLLEVKA